LVFKDHSQPSPGWLPRLICALADFVIQVDLSRSRRPALFAGPSSAQKMSSPEMKKAAEVDFTWAASARTYEKRL